MGYRPPPLKLMQARSLLKNIGYKVWFFQIGKINRKTAPKKKRPRGPAKPKVFLPDLMAEMLKTDAVDTPQTCQQPIMPETVAKYLKSKKEILKVSHPIQKPCYVPNPVDNRITRVEPPKKAPRPPAIYTNIPSPYGIATEMLKEQLKKSG